MIPAGLVGHGVSREVLEADVESAVVAALRGDMSAFDRVGSMLDAVDRPRLAAVARDEWRRRYDAGESSVTVRSGTASR